MRAPTVKEKIKLQKKKMQSEGVQGLDCNILLKKNLNILLVKTL